jgi:hypothetical protein
MMLSQVVSGGWREDVGRLRCGQSREVHRCLVDVRMDVVPQDAGTGSELVLSTRWMRSCPRPEADR